MSDVFDTADQICDLLKRYPYLDQEDLARQMGCTEHQVRSLMILGNVDESVRKLYRAKRVKIKDCIVVGSLPRERQLLAVLGNVF